MSASSTSSSSGSVSYILNFKLSRISHLDLAGDIIHKQSHASKLGGYADVYSAWSMKYKKKVAVKQVRIHMAKDLAFKKKFAKEMRIWADLHHEAVLPFLGYFFEGKEMLPSLVSEWMERGTVDVFMKKFPRGGEDTWNMVGWIASGLAYLHSQGVIHADLKSQNILISPSGTPLLADFGLSVALSYSTMATTTFNIRGTTRWMAIELLLPDSSLSDSTKLKHTARTDVWAFGMVTYELLSGYVPYHDKPSDASVILAIASKQLPARPAYNKYSRFAARLWRLCERCWALNPCMRPTSAEVLHVLKEKAKQTPSSVQDQAQPVALLPGPSTGPFGQGGRELVALRDSSAPSTTSRPSRRSEDAKPNRLQKKSYATSSRATITSEDVKPRRLVKSPPEFRQDSPPGSRRTFGSRRWTW